MGGLSACDDVDEIEDCCCCSADDEDGEDSSSLKSESLFSFLVPITLFVNRGFVA